MMYIRWYDSERRRLSLTRLCIHQALYPISEVVSTLTVRLTTAAAIYIPFNHDGERRDSLDQDLVECRVKDPDHPSIELIML